jgi:hypothetical protein
VKTPHLLRVEEPPEPFAALFAAVAALGLRAGWLELAGPVEPIPPRLASAASLGALRAVAVAEARSVVVKPHRGAVVLKDLLREHFRGCALVLIHAPAEAAPDLPRLARAGEEWRVHPTGEAERAYTLDRLAASLRKPRPWAE